MTAQGEIVRTMQSCANPSNEIKKKTHETLRNHKHPLNSLDRQWVKVSKIIQNPKNPRTPKPKAPQSPKNHNTPPRTFKKPLKSPAAHLNSLNPKPPTKLLKFHQPRLDAEEPSFPDLIDPEAFGGFPGFEGSKIRGLGFTVSGALGLGGCLEVHG